jgi:hypothetical protein
VRSGRSGYHAIAASRRRDFACDVAGLNDLIDLMHNLLTGHRMVGLLMVDLTIGILFDLDLPGAGVLGSRDAWRCKNARSN